LGFHPAVVEFAGLRFRAGPVSASSGEDLGRIPDAEHTARMRQDLTEAKKLLRRALAWRAGGPGCLAVLDASWDAGPEALARGRALLGPGATGRRNRLTLGERQLRLGRDGRWYPFVKRGPTWDPDGPPIDDGEDDPPSEADGEEMAGNGSDR
jgi:hypothetical protein